MARDGEVVRTPMLIMDAAGVDLHRPGFCCATDATARDAVRDGRREMIDRATTAWRNDARRKPPDDDDDDEDDERERHSDDARGNADARPRTMRCVQGCGMPGGGPWMLLSPTLAPGRKS
jgi:hypothetical protein